MCGKQGVLSTVLMLLGAWFAIAGPQGNQGSPYRLLTTIGIAGDDGWDYGSVDAAARKLYYTHGTKIVVIDIDRDAVVGEITDTPGVHGFALAPELGLGFSSNGRENKAGIVDLKRLTTKMKVDTGANPDAILYDPGQKEVYTFNGRGRSATVFDARSGKVVATVPLPGKPEFAQVDVKAGLVYANIEDKSLVVAIDTKAHRIVETWPIAPAESPTGMAIDLANRRLFIGAERVLVMMDYGSGKVVTTTPIGAGVDFCWYDAAAKLVFASCGDGTVTIAHQDSPDKLTVVQTLQTARGARTMAFDPITRKIYLAAAEYESPQTQGRRPRMIPGSFRILVYGTGGR